MIIDLTSSGFRFLTLFITLEASHDEVRKIWESTGLEDGHRVGDGYHYLEIAGFRTGGQYYRVNVELTTGEEDGPSLILHYALGELRRKKARRANLDKIGRALNDLACPCSVGCSAHADVPSDRFKPIVGLPLLQFNMPHEYFDEIRGIRVARRMDDGESESVGLDMQEEGELHVYAQTSFKTALSSNVVSDALSRLATLRNRAITEVQPDI